MIDKDRFNWTKSDIQQLIEQQKNDSRKSKRTAVVESALPKPAKGEKFIRGPLPLDWIQQAIPCGRKALNVCLAIWHLAGFKQQSPIKLSPATLAEFGVSSQTARKILVRLESAGLVAVDRKSGRSPIVKIFPANHPRIDGEQK